MKRLLASFLIVCGISAITWADDTPDDTDQPAVVVPPDATITDLRQYIQDKQYMPAIQLDTRLLTSASPTDRYELLMLKAQCNLATKSMEIATSSFAAAAKAAKTTKDATTASGDCELAKHSPLAMYRPRYSQDLADATDTTASPPFNITFSRISPDPDPIDIVDPTNRPEAMKALFIDELQLVLPDLKRAVNSQTVPPLLSALTKLSRLRQLEIAANGADTQTAAMFKALAANAQKLMTTELTAMTQEETQCNRDLTGRGGNGGNGAQRGLTAADRSALEDIISTCNDIISSCKDFTTTTPSAGTTDTGTATTIAATGPFAAIITQAQTLLTNANNLLNNIPIAGANGGGGRGGRGGRGGGGGAGGGGNGGGGNGGGAGGGAGGTGGGGGNTNTPAAGG